MISNIFDPELDAVFAAMQTAAARKSSKQVQVNGNAVTVPFPFPSPTDWRDNWIYFIMVDRFNNPLSAPVSSWNEYYGFRQGGTINGIRQQLDYIATLGAGAIWLTPLLKNATPAQWEWNYHGYAIQDFLSIDGRFSSDGTSETAEKELTALIEEAHARGIFVIMDIVLNHTARTFDYVLGDGTVVGEFKDELLINGPAGHEPSIEWINGQGTPVPAWKNDLPGAGQLSADDVIWPSDFQRAAFFRRRGVKLDDTVRPDTGFVMGDFDTMRQLVVEYTIPAGKEKDLQQRYGVYPVLDILVEVYRYFMAKFDIDGYRIDTIKYVRPDMVEMFGNAMREAALSIGKHNFFTFGEIWDTELTLGPFIGRHSTDGFGIDAALDFPLFGVLPHVAKAQADVSALAQVFDRRKELEEGHLSSHGEAGKYFVSFLDNHDQHERFNHSNTPPEQVLAGLAMLFCLQGIPCIYYGTEQGLQGVVHPQNANEDVREALWGKPSAFDESNTFYQHLQTLGNLRYAQPALLYGRLYFRNISLNGTDFFASQGSDGIVAFSRILANTEVLCIYNANTNDRFRGFAIVDAGINRNLPHMRVAYSNFGTNGEGQVTTVSSAMFHGNNNVTAGDAVALYVELAPMEIQILVPA